MCARFPLKKTEWEKSLPKTGMVRGWKVIHKESMKSSLFDGLYRAGWNRADIERTRLSYVHNRDHEGLHFYLAERDVAPYYACVPVLVRWEDIIGVEGLETTTFRAAQGVATRVYVDRKEWAKRGVNLPARYGRKKNPHVVAWN